MDIYQKFLSVFGLIRTSIGLRALREELAPLFNVTQSYVPGRLVIYENELYRCTASHSGSWDAENFVKTTIDEAIANMGVNKEEVEKIVRKIIDATDTGFSKAVLGVGLKIDADTLKWLKEIGAIAQTTTETVSLSTLIPAILTAIIYLDNNKFDSEKVSADNQTFKDAVAACFDDGDKTAYPRAADEEG